MYYHYLVSYCIQYNGYYLYDNIEATTDEKPSSYDDYIDLRKAIAELYEDVDWQNVKIFRPHLIRDEKY